MKKQPILQIFGLLIGITGIILTFVWFSWKLALILFLLMWANNISQK